MWSGEVLERNSLPQYVLRVFNLQFRWSLGCVLKLWKAEYISYLALKPRELGIGICKTHILSKTIGGKGGSKSPNI